MSEFRSFGKIPRYNRPVIITEKIDGTNAQVYIEHVKDADAIARLREDPTVLYAQVVDDDVLALRAGSRNRWLTLSSDNFGFAAWAQFFAKDLLPSP